MRGIRSADWVAALPAAQEASQMLIVACAGMDRTDAVISMHGVEEDWELPEPQSLDGHLHESSLLDWLLP